QAFCCFRTAFAHTSLANLKGTSTGFFRSKGLVQPHKARTQTLNLPFGWETSKKQRALLRRHFVISGHFCSNKFGKVVLKQQNPTIVGLCFFGGERGIRTLSNTFIKVYFSISYVN